MSKIAIIDADLIGRQKHRFPNLVCMKLSGYHKSIDDEVELKIDYDNLDEYDKVYIAKVFTDTQIDNKILELPNVEYSGTGFYYDRAKPLKPKIEHFMPDYNLYDKWIEKQIKSGKEEKEFKNYRDYSVGFTTRGCFRMCQFCINKNRRHVKAGSPIKEFLDTSRKKICLLDDNFFGYSGYEPILKELQETGKPFVFKQGLDIRLLTDRKCELLFSSKYDGEYIFAFDNIADKNLINKKIQLARQYTDKVMKLYCFTGYDREQKYDKYFWKKDIIDLFKRIKILIENRCLPYVMRHEMYKHSPYYGIYVVVAGWCNQPQCIKKLSLADFSLSNKSRERYVQQFIDEFKDYPEVLQYINMKWE